MKISKFKIASFFIGILLIANAIKGQTIALLQQNKQTSIRGLSVVDNKIAWVSGSKGYIAITTNGGTTWTWQQVKGFEKADFRDIEAFSAKEAVIMSSGTPALTLKTIDGGTNWQVNYKNIDTAYFFDAMDFVNSNDGWILGDPINNKFLLLRCADGKTWTQYKNTPTAVPGEAAFAASGTCILTTKHDIWIVSGGSSSNVKYFNRREKIWNTYPVALLKGKSSQGSFSIAKGKGILVIVGGDYLHDKRNDSTSCYSTDKGVTWQLARTSPFGFQSCVEYITNSTFLSTGTSGTNITNDGGENWSKIDETSFNVCRKAKHGTLVLLAGNGGKIGVLKLH